MLDLLGGRVWSFWPLADIWTDGSHTSPLHTCSISPRSEILISLKKSKSCVETYLIPQFRELLDNRKVYSQLHL